MFDVMSYIQGPTFEIAGTVYGAMTVTKEIAGEAPATIP